jgi:carbonic anhydrase
MRLFEAIVEANQRAASSDVSLDLEPYAASLPIVALTCVDPRLNRHFPNALGVPEDKFIWLRNAGNIIFDPMSSMTRTLALSVAVKGGKEIAIIGHTECLVGKVSISDLTDRFRAVGVERSRLPDNLNEFFGLFASERQNVIRATDFVRQSPLIGPKVPVHGLLINTDTGRLEWVVNGYQTFASTVSAAASTTDSLGTRQSTVPMADFKMGEIKFPEMKIGDVTTPYTPVSSPAQQTTTPQTPMRENRRVEIRRQAEQAAQAQAQAQAEGAAQEQSPLSALGLNLSHMYKVMGDDQKVYGPVLGREIQRWINEGRIDLNTLAQKVGYKNWKRLADFAEEMESHSKTPPTIPFSNDKRS